MGLGDQRLAIAGETILLLPERALYWRGSATLVVADLHWGKAATFRAAGIPVPGGTTADDLARLDRALGRTGAERLVILGDLFHARTGRLASRTGTELRRWRDRHNGLAILLVRGNHDRGAGDPAPELGIRCLDAPHRIAPFVLRHEPAEDEGGYGLAGHVHPGLTLVGRGGSWECLPCFLMGPRAALLPAFGSFTGLARVEPRPDERAFVVAESEVVEVRA